LAADLLAMDAESLALHRETSMAAVAYSSQAKGFFSGAYGRGVDQPQARSAKAVLRNYYSDENFDRLDRAQELASQLGCTANDIALAYLIAHPFPSFAIVGCRTVDQVQSSCRGADVVLTAEQVKWLNGAA